MIFKRPSLLIVATLAIGLCVTVTTHKNLSADLSGGGGGSNSGGGSSLICAETPPHLELSNQFKVSTVDGQSQVTLNWDMLNGQDPHATQKIEVLMDYLKSDHTLGQGTLKMKNAFAYEIYHQLSTSENRLVKTKLSEALAQTVQGSEILKDRHIETLFEDYYPYLFVDQLKNNTSLSEAFARGVESSLAGDSLDWKTLLKNTASNLKTVQNPGPLSQAIRCSAQGISGVKIDRFKPSEKDNVYGPHAAKMNEMVDTLRAEGKIQPVLEAIKNDRELIQNTQLAAKAGANRIVSVWAENSNVQNLVKLYETDANVRQLVKLFFESKVGGKMDTCIKDAYKGDLLTLTGDVYAQMITPQLQSSTVYNDAQTKVMFPEPCLCHSSLRRCNLLAVSSSPRRWKGREDIFQKLRSKRSTAGR